ncbi:hypothetical protein BASA81_007522 [Batrachochytrium salamandrivorans]|nr:hypothetical protein BASA81_007522 [Batrachochytrium salamandrivorans]
MVRIIEHVARGGVDRHRTGIGGGVGLLPSVQLKRLKVGARLRIPLPGLSVWGEGVDRGTNIWFVWWRTTVLPRASSAQPSMKASPLSSAVVATAEASPTIIATPSSYHSLELGQTEAVDLPEPIKHQSKAMFLLVAFQLYVQQQTDLSGDLLGFGVLVSVWALVMTLVEFYLVRQTSAVLFSFAAILKEIMVITVALLVNGDSLPALNILGFICCILGIIAYQRYKFSKYDEIKPSG